MDDKKIKYERLFVKGLMYLENITITQLVLLDQFYPLS